MLSNNPLSESLEVKYQSFLKGEKIQITRLLCVLNSVLYAAFVVVDLWALSSAVVDVLIIRACVISCMCIVYALTYTSLFEKYYSHIIASNYLITALGIEAMILIASPSDQAYEVYFVGIILTLISLFSWTYLKFRESVPLTILIILGYVCIEMIERDTVGNAREAALVSNLFFLCSAAIIGCIGQLMRDRYLRENFLLQQSLQQAYKEKELEADKNQYLANHDVLTGLPNRRRMMELLEESRLVAEQSSKRLAIMFLDLDGFKKVNDTYGHAAGDAVLIAVAKRLESGVRKDDHVSRLGGDEYLIGITLKNSDVNEVIRIAKKLGEAVAQPINIEGIQVKVGSSIGVAVYPFHGDQISTLLDIADKNMYRSKKRKEVIAIDDISFESGVGVIS